MTGRWGGVEALVLVHVCLQRHSQPARRRLGRIYRAIPCRAHRERESGGKHGSPTNGKARASACE